MAKMLRIKSCVSCDVHTADMFCPRLNENIAKGITGSIHIHPDCPLPDAEPAPYSAENLPKENDLVRVWDGIGQETRIGFVECTFRKNANVRFVHEGTNEAHTEHFMATDLTLIYRPPSGDTP